MPGFPMLRRVPISLAGGLLVSFLAVATLASQAQPATLTGTWKFDPQRSAEERKVETGSDPRAGEGMARDRPRGPPPVPGQRSGPAELGAMARFAMPSPQMVIVQADSTITIALPNGVSETYRLDGRKETIEVPGAQPIEISARWRGGKLTVEKKFGSTGSIREVYSLAAQGKELRIEVRITGADIPTPVDQKRVYDLIQ